MIDRFGRPVNSLRISITSRCNLNCLYCHGEGHPGRALELSAAEISRIVREARDLGIGKIKITGGEPLVREDIVEILKSISEMKFSDISLSTNGTLLAGFACQLADAGLDRINISLDTLDEEKYKRITGAPLLKRVIEGIDAAIAAGLSPIKINMVVLRGVNEDEIDPMVDMVRERGLILQLIELVNLSPPGVFRQFHASLDKIEESLERRASRVWVRKEMQARRKYLVDGAEVEVVRPMHNSEFCAYCTRLRLTADGWLKPCLLREDNLVDVLTLSQNEGSMELRRAFLTAVSLREPFFK